MPSIPTTLPWTATGKTIGAGRQAQVVEVKPSNSEVPSQTAVMKVLSNTGSAQALKRFYREIKAIGEIDDPRIVRILDHSLQDNSDDFHFYVMPVYENTVLLDSIAWGDAGHFRARPKELLEFIAQCAEAVALVHSADVIHRDIKPSNILLDQESGLPVILDFGCCYMNEEGNAVTLIDEGVGTPNYMAPESEIGSDTKVERAADVYSLGKLLWALLTGERAFARERPAFTNKQLKNVLPNDPDCWHAMEIVRRSIRRMPLDRYHNAAEMAEHCNHIARQVVGILRPLETVARRCPACGGTDLIESNHRITEPLNIDMFCIIGNAANNPELVGRFCKRCGYISIFDTRPVKMYEKSLEGID
ncbi:MAG: serine/threonine protein kinase [Planctomycetes bacterium]|nr:serine/threonine protein kinase [Planctomycetota bacterium]